MDQSVSCMPAVALALADTERQSFVLLDDATYELVGGGDATNGY